MMNIDKAVEVLEKEIKGLEHRQSLHAGIIRGIRAVSHHAKVTSRVVDAIKGSIGDSYVVILNKAILKAHRLEIWGGGMGFDHRLRIDGDNYAELISDLGRYNDQPSIDEIKKTIENLSKAAEYKKRAKELESEIKRELPGLSYIRDLNGFDELYKLTCLYFG